MDRPQAPLVSFCELDAATWAGECVCVCVLVGGVCVVALPWGWNAHQHSPRCPGFPSLSVAGWFRTSSPQRISKCLLCVHRELDDWLMGMRWPTTCWKQPVIRAPSEVFLPCWVQQCFLQACPSLATKVLQKMWGDSSQVESLWEGSGTGTLCWACVPSNVLWGC